MTSGELRDLRQTIGWMMMVVVVMMMMMMMRLMIKGGR
jgi:hypothetical protein